MRYYIFLLIALCSMIVVGLSQLHLRNDIDVFLPEKALDDIPASRLLAKTPQASVIMLGIEGASKEKLLRISDALVPQLEALEEIERASNGTFGFSDGFLQTLFSRRYHLAEHPGHELTVKAITDYLHWVTPKLSSSQAMALISLIPRDPSGVFHRLVESWEPMIAPTLFEGAWFSDDYSKAFLLAYQEQTPFDADKQAVLREKIYHAFERVSEGEAVLRMFSPYMVALTTHEAISKEAVRLSVVAMFGILMLLWFWFRRISQVLFILLPLAFGALCAIATVQLLFGYVHGLALAFGITLMGLSVDYPIHMMLHPDKRHSWRMVVLGAITTSVGFLAMCFSYLPGLQQLGVFVVVGLIGALVLVFGMASFVFPKNILRFRPHRYKHVLLYVPKLSLRVVMVVVVLGAFLLASWAQYTSIWNEDTTALTPVPKHLLKEEFAMRQMMHAPDARYMLLVEGKHPQDVLLRSEALIPLLNDWKQEGLFVRYDLAARYVPSIARQQMRLSELNTVSLEQNITQAVKEVGGFALEAFEQSAHFIREDAALPVIDPHFFDKTPLAPHIGQLLSTDDEGAYGVVLLSGLTDPQALRVKAENSSLVAFVDMRETFAQVLDGYRKQAVMLALLGAGAVLLVLLLWMKYLAFRVLLPVCGAVIITIGGLLLIGETLSLFHITALLLVVGIGIDYGLFYATSTKETEQETLRAIGLCSLTSLIAFGTLSTSWVPVLHAMGVTVSMGVVSVLILGRLLQR